MCELAILGRVALAGCSASASTTVTAHDPPRTVETVHGDTIARIGSITKPFTTSGGSDETHVDNHRCC
jgi:hypothetical protein